MKTDLILNKTIVAGFLEFKEDDLFEVYLINLSNISFSRVVKRTGSSFENMNSNICEKEYKNFDPNTVILVDESDLGELDFNIWYMFELYENKNEREEKSIVLDLSINWHDIYRQTLTQLPIIGKTGKIMELREIVRKNSN